MALWSSSSVSLRGLAPPMGCCVTCLQGLHSCSKLTTRRSGWLDVPTVHAMLATRAVQGIVLPAFETLDDGEVGKQTALKAIKSECRPGCMRGCGGLAAAGMYRFRQACAWP